MVTYCYVVIGFIQIPNSIPAYNVTYVVEVSMLSVLLDLVPAHSVSLLEPALNGVRSFEIVNIKEREISLEPVIKNVRGLNLSIKNVRDLNLSKNVRGLNLSLRNV